MSTEEKSPDSPEKNSKTAELPKGKMKEKEENYLFLGLPGAGKTTYFTVMAQTLQNLAVKGDVMKFRFENDETYDFIRAGYEAITASEPGWPDKSITYTGGYEFSLMQRIRLLGCYLPWRFGHKRASVRYHDYPGEAFQAAFGNAKNNAYAEQAEMMRQQIRGARGVFLVMDADKLFNGEDKREMERTAEHLFKFIGKGNPKVRLAILFNKLELFEGLAEDCNFADMFRDRFTSAYSWLPRKSQFFDVYPIGKLDVNDDGIKVPAREIAPRGVLEPVRWMIGFKGKIAE